jgi:NADP-dependent 3-hydroxy acid dehydrogenase YdfG
MAASTKACQIGPKTWKRNQREIIMKIIVITGASSGFGALTARALAKAGHTLYASMRDTTGQNARKVEEVKKFAKENKVDLRSIELDVTSQASVDAAIQKIVGENKRLDVVIHNAGHMVFGPAEAFTPEQLAELYARQRAGGIMNFPARVNLRFRDCRHGSEQQSADCSEQNFPHLSTSEVNRRDSSLV